jgi:sugar lactone lactonase YvrE
VVHFRASTKINNFPTNQPKAKEVKILVKVDSPNGVTFGSDSTLYIVTFQKPGRIYAYKNGHLKLIFRSHDIDGGDGIVFTKEGKLIVSGFISGKIVEYELSSGKHRVLKSGLETPADISLSQSQKKLYIPLLQAGRIIEMPVSY